MHLGFPWLFSWLDTSLLLCWYSPTSYWTSLGFAFSCPLLAVLGEYAWLCAQGALFHSCWGSRGIICDDRIGSAVYTVYKASSLPMELSLLAQNYNFNSPFTNWRASDWHPRFDNCVFCHTQPCWERKGVMLYPALYSEVVSGVWEFIWCRPPAYKDARSLLHCLSTRGLAFDHLCSGMVFHGCCNFQLPNYIVGALKCG